MSQQINDNNQQSSLTDFSFDGDGQDWFGMEANKEDVTTIGANIKEIKSSEINKQEGTTQQVSSLDSSKEDEDEEDVTFFEEPKKSSKKAEAKPTATAKKEETEEEDDDEEDEVADVVEAKEEEEEDDEDDKKEKDEKFFSTLASELKEKGIFQNVEIKEGEEITEEKFFELQDAEIEARVEETFEAFKEELDEDGRDFIKFKKNGGKTEDFMALLQDKTIDLENFNENDAKQVTKVLRHYYTVHEELDAEELADKLEWLKDGGKEKAYALKFVGKMQKDLQAKKEALLEQTEKVSIEREKKAKKFNQELESIIDSTDKVGAFTLSKTDQKELKPYMTKPSIKVGTNRYIPQLQADLHKVLRAETEEDKKNLIILSKLLKNNFNVDGLVKESATKVTNKIKSKLQEAKSSGKKSSGVGRRRALSDFFGD